MREGFLSQYFDGVVVKRLSHVEADTQRSNQHEFNGVMPLRRLLGDETLSDCPTRFVWLGEDDEAISVDSSVTWYDARRKHPTRTEYRLYFRSNDAMEKARGGDLLILARRPSGAIMVIVVASGTTVENQLLWLFGETDTQQGEGFHYKDLEQNDLEVDLAVRYVLDELGIEIEEPEADRLDELLKSKGYVDAFPPTRVFSAYARETTQGDIDPRIAPDAALMAWMEQEEKLFRRLEHNIVSRQLEDQFTGVKEIDVDLFVSYSLSVHNRRKSRAGYALENHLEAIFQACEVRYDNQAVTENKKKPDFLFPGAAEYHDPDYPEASLTMLGVKSSCKDRWRQVLSEAKRVKNKHLLTLEPGISQNQTDEMAASHLQLVLPKELHTTYSHTQQQWLMDLKSFVEMVKSRQGNSDSLPVGQNVLF
jgi:hypothetical protein